MVYVPGPIEPGSANPVEQSGTQPLISLPDGDTLTEGVVAVVAVPEETGEAGAPPSHAVMTSRTTALDRRYREAWARGVKVTSSFVEARECRLPSQPISAHPGGWPPAVSRRTTLRYARILGR